MENAVHDAVRSEHECNTTEDTSIQNSTEITIATSIEDIRPKDMTKWIYPFEDNDNIQICEHGDQEYVYVNVLDPESKKTNYFKGFYRDLGNNDNDWKIMNGLLSSRYIGASVSGFINNKCKNIETTIIKTKKEPFYLSKFLYTTQDLNLFDDESSQIVFQIVTGLKDELFLNFKSKSTLMISNSYNGTMSLRIDFITSNIIQNQCSMVKFDDYFILNKQSYTLQHIMTSGIDRLDTDFCNVQVNLDASIKYLKEYNTDIDKHIENIGSKFNKKSDKSSFLSLCENLIDDYKNMFYILIIASIVLNNNYDIQSHKSIRTYVDKFEILNKK
jgi:hypothetical protein